MSLLLQGMKFTRWREKPKTLHVVLGDMEYSIAMGYYMDNEACLAELDAYRTLKQLRPAQVEAVSAILREAFESGLREGCARERYKEDD